MNRCIILYAGLLLAGLASCATPPPAVPTTPATAVYFSNQEPGGEPYRTRMIVTPAFLRMDDGEGSRDYLLFDRTDATIYSVSSGDRLILVMRRRRVDMNPPETLVRHVVVDTASYPAVDGRKVAHYELVTNRQRCYDLYAADGLLPDVVVALRQYHAALAGQQAATLAVTPAEFRTPCDMDNNVFLPVRQLDYGFPVRLVDMTGRMTQLMDYQTDFRASDDLFQLPADYPRRTLNELRGK